MKRLVVLVIALACLVPAGLAQVKSLKTAKKYLQQEKYSDAASLIEDVVKNDETAIMPDAWSTRGKIYLAIARNPLMMREYPNAADWAKESFEKAITMDGKNQLLLRNDLNGLVNIFYDNGARKFETGDFAAATAEFEKSFAVSQMEGVYDTTIMFNMALCAANANLLDKAIEYYKTLVDAEYPAYSVYTGLADVYFRSKQNDLVDPILEKAVVLFPDERNMYIQASSVYLRMGANEKASEILNTALEKWSNDAPFQLFIGIAYENDGKYDEAEAAYLKALEINPDYAEAVFNTGAFYVNKGIRIRDEANNLPLEEDAKYAELDAQAKDVFNKAIPYLLKVVEAQPNNVNVMTTLRDVYMQLGQAAKAKEWGDKVKELE